MSEHPEIWLEPEPPADCEWGRQWCQHNVWGERAAHYVLVAAPAPTVSGEADWKRAFAAQSRKLQAVLHIPGVKEEVASLDWPSGDPAPTRAEVLEEAAQFALDQTCDSPENTGNWNDACEYIAGRLRSLAGEKS